MATPRIQWIQYNELVVGENHPIYPDNDNRPLKQMCQYSNLNPQADDFPGFIGCYQGAGDPNGVQTGNVRNAFWDIDNADFWMKQTGDATNTGWVLIGGGSASDHLVGDVIPENVAATQRIGKFYDQQVNPPGGLVSVDPSEMPTWVKRDVPIYTQLSRDWANGANDADIDGRTPDGGTVTGMNVGAWLRNSAVGLIAISGSFFVPTSPGTVACYNLNSIPGITTSQWAQLVVSKAAGVSSIVVGVGARVSTAAVSGYFVTIVLDNGVISIYKIVAGALTLLSSGGNLNAYSGNDKWDIRLGIRCIDNPDTNLVDIEALINGILVSTTSDATFFGQVGTPAIYASDAGGMTPLPNPYAISEFIAGTWVKRSDTGGWYAQNGFERNRSVAIGSFSHADDFDYTTNGFSGKNNDIGSVAIGHYAYAAVPDEAISHTYCSIAIGSYAQAFGDGNVAIGDSSIAVAVGTTAVGGASSAREENTTAIGFGANAYKLEATAIGINCQAGGIDSLAIGSNSEVANGGDFSIAIGKGAFVDFTITDSYAMGQDSIVQSIKSFAFGRSAFVGTTADGSIAFGDDTSVANTHANSIALGRAATTTAANQFVVGGPAFGITNVLVGNGDAVAAPSALTFRKTNSLGANIAAGDWTFEAGRSTGTATPGNFLFKVTVPTGAGSTLQTLSTRLQIHQTGATVTGVFKSDGVIVGINTITYSASMTPDAALGEIQVITATNGTAFTINAPTNPATGALLNITIRNTSGGALGAITWNAVFKMATVTAPATGQNRTWRFYYNGTNWIEMARDSDVPN